MLFVCNPELNFVILFTQEIVIETVIGVVDGVMVVDEMTDMVVEVVAGMVVVVVVVAAVVVVDMVVVAVVEDGEVVAAVVVEKVHVILGMGTVFTVHIRKNLFKRNKSEIPHTLFTLKGWSRKE